MSRVLSAVALITLVLATVWWLPAWVTLVLAACAAGLAAAELAGLSAGLGAPVSPVFLGGAAAVICVAFCLRVPQLGAVDDALGAVLLALILAVGAVLLGSGPPNATTVPRAAMAFMAPLYAGLPLGALSAVQFVHGPRAVTVLFALVAASDSAQYYTGRLAGRRKLAPAVSPAKTVEGAIGGLAAASLIGATLGARWIDGVSPLGGATLGLVLGVLGIVGDLFESLLKRSAGVKDSSALIPGHGGVLDRIDSWLFAAPAYYLFLRYFV